MDYTTIVFISCFCLGITAGTAGSFLLGRKLALMGDVIGHSVLPGIAIAFLAAGFQKVNAFIFIGALSAAYLAYLCFEYLNDRFGLRRDSAMAIVLAGFYSIGTTLLSHIRNHAGSSQAGLDRYLLGQAAAIQINDLFAIALIMMIVLSLAYAFFKEFQATCFDPAFVRSQGHSLGFMKSTMAAMIGATVVVSLQASGAVLASAMLILPTAISNFMGRRFHERIFCSALVGGIMAVGGTWVSSRFDNAPTGPSIILVGLGLFILAWLFAPAGFLASQRRIQQRQRRHRDENFLKAIFYWNEKQNDLAATDWVRHSHVVQRLSNSDLARFESTVKRAVRKRLVEDRVAPDGNRYFRFLDQGFGIGADVVRKHRLWELYLIRKLDFKVADVHLDAERTEHFIDDKIIREIEETLGHPQIDPHGKKIPSIKDLHELKVPGY